MYRSAKRDKNEPRIRKFFERCGARVVQLDDPGIPDLLVGYQGHNLLVEVKTKKGTLTARQKEFMNCWKGQATVVRNYRDAKLVLRRLSLPTYTYRCEACSKVTTAVQSFFDAPLTACPDCEGKLIRVIVSVPVIIYRGNGWAGKHD